MVPNATDVDVNATVVTPRKTITGDEIRCGILTYPFVITEEESHHAIRQMTDLFRGSLTVTPVK